MNPSGARIAGGASQRLRALKGTASDADGLLTGHRLQDKEVTMDYSDNIFFSKFGIDPDDELNSYDLYADLESSDLPLDGLSAGDLRMETDIDPENDI